MAHYKDGVYWQDCVQQDLTEHLAEELCVSTTHSGDWYIEPTCEWFPVGKWYPDKGYGEFIIGEEVYDRNVSESYAAEMEYSFSILPGKEFDTSVSDGETKRIRIDDVEFDRMFDDLSDDEPATYTLKLLFCILNK